MNAFRKMNIEVVAASVDAIDEAREGAERLDVSFRLAYGVDARKVSSETGAFYEGDKGYLQPAAFIINPEGKIVNAVFSTGPRGRLLARECLTYFPRALGG